MWAASFRGTIAVPGRSTQSLDRTKMARCPHCGRDTISAYAKRWSSAARPAKCKQCSGLSYIARGQFALSSAIVGGLSMLMLPAVLIARSLWAGALVIAAILFIIVYDELAFYRAPMLPTTEGAAGDLRRWDIVGVFILATIAAIAVAGVLRAV